MLVTREKLKELMKRKFMAAGMHDDRRPDRKSVV